MMSRLAPLALALLLLPQTLRAQALDLAFLPPAVEPQELCAGVLEANEDDLSLGVNEETDQKRLTLRFLRRDIRNLAAEDADRWFDHILALIDWQARLDPDFAGAGALLAKIALHVDAGRLDQLQAAGLIDQLRRGAVAMTGTQKLALAQYYLNGIGVAADIPYAQGLIRDAAYGGTVDALMTIARMEAGGSPMPEWDAPLDLTVSLAFGGMLGPMNPDICRRALRIAREYETGTLVARNPAIAYAWTRLAADLGGRDAAWRVVEYHLGGEAPVVDTQVMLQYLTLAVTRGFSPDATQADRLAASGALTPEGLRALIGPNHVDTGATLRPTVARHFRLALNPDAIEIAEDGPYLQYLREVATFPTAPGFVFTRLAQEVLVKLGRWKGEAEAMALLEEAARRGDGEGMRMLGQMTLRYRDDPARVARAVSLLSRAATEAGIAPALQDLDGLFRCQLNEAPLVAEADRWAAAWRASQHAAPDVNPEDLLVLSPFREPETIARIQSQAIDGRVEALAQHLERVQMDPVAGEGAELLWAGRTQSSDKALELFAELEFILATNPAERERAVELFRRVYVNNGVTTALDLSVALVEHDGRNPAIAAEIVTLLTQAGNRGEGASIRLLARLTGDRRHAESLSVPPRTEAEVYAEFAQAIADRGDFLALMFAIPHVDVATAQDYLDRAASQMACSSKDVEEMGDAHAILQEAAETYRWRQVGLAIEGGHVLSRLDLTRRQMAAWGTRAAPDAAAVAAREVAEGAGAGARRQLYALTADPNLPGYDPAAAAGHLVALLQAGGDEGFALAAYADAAPAVAAAVDRLFDMAPLFSRAAQGGDAAAAHAWGRLLQARATGPGDLAQAAGWLQRAAEAGHPAAMAAFGQALALGVGTAPDRAAAIGWLEKAAAAGEADAGDLARLLARAGG
jgi:TPR repeat protein